MSRNDWERAEILLPASEQTRIARVLRGAQNELHDQLLAEAARFWNEYARRTRSSRRYEDALENWEADTRKVHGRWMSETVHASGLPDSVRERLGWILGELGERPHKLTRAELEEECPRATSRTKHFPIGEGTITLDGRKLSWNISENNHAVSGAYDHPVMQALQRALESINWTRGSGGRVWGWDEYAQEAAENSQGAFNAVQVEHEYGPTRVSARRPAGRPSHA